MKKRLLNVKIPVDLFDELEEYRKEMGMSRTSTIALMIKTYLNSQKALDFMSKNRDIKETIDKKLKELETMKNEIDKKEN